MRYGGMVFLFTLLCFAHLIFAEQNDSSQSIKVLENPLRSVEERERAMNQLLISPPPELSSTLLPLFKNPKEPIIFRGIIANGMVRLNTPEIQTETRKIVFNKSEADPFAREKALSIFLRMLNQKELEKLFPELVSLAQRGDELAELRKATIGYLSNAKFIPEKATDWAQKIIQNKREETQVRTAALNYMEVNQNIELSSILPSLISDETENSDLRQIAILKAARMPSETLAASLQSIIADQNEDLKIRKLCLGVLINYMPVENPIPFLNQTLIREKSSSMQEELKEVIAAWKKK